MHFCARDESKVLKKTKKTHQVKIDTVDIVWKKQLLNDNESMRSYISKDSLEKVDFQFF